MASYTIDVSVLLITFSQELSRFRRGNVLNALLPAHSEECAFCKCKYRTFLWSYKLFDEKFNCIREKCREIAGEMT